MNAVARIPERVARGVAWARARSRAVEPDLGGYRHHATAPRRWTSLRKPKDRMNVPIASTTAMAAA